MKIDLLRHGELEGGIRYRGCLDDPLTSRGWEQMQEVWEKLAASVARIYASPLSRCREPAQSWQAAHPSVILRIDERLREMDYGEWEGLNMEQIARRDADLLRRWREDPSGLCPPGGETYDSFCARVQSFCEQLWKVEEEHVLIVCHSGSFRLLLQSLLAMPAACARRFDVPYACWSRIHRRESRCSLVFHHRLGA